MTHWRKSYQPTSRFDSIAVWAIAATMFVGAIVFVATHLYA
jgi:hypothetical protein